MSMPPLRLYFFLSWFKSFRRIYRVQVAAHLPAFDVRLPFLQNLQLLHLPLGLVDAGAHGLHHLQGLLHQRVVAVFPRGPFQQFLHVQNTENYKNEIPPTLNPNRNCLRLLVGEALKTCVKTNPLHSNLGV